MEEDFSSTFNNNEEEFIDILNTLSILDDSFTEENVFINSFLDKLLIKLDIKTSLLEISISKKILKILGKPKGSLELQNILPELTTNMCDKIYDTVSQAFININL